MKTFLVLGAGSAGTLIANKMAAKLDPSEWKVVVVDKHDVHYYQPGYLFLPFGVYHENDVVKTKKQFINRRAEFILSEIDLIEPDASRVKLVKDNRVINYDYLVIATGCDIHPEQTEGMTGAGWRKNVFDFYTFDGAMALANFLKTFEGGRVVVSITEMPVKCPVAPLEFILLADWYFKQRGIRSKVDLVYATPLPGAFTKPRASTAFGQMLSKRGIQVESDFCIGEVDSSRNVIASYDEREIPYDLLVTVPTNMGDPLIERSGMGDDLNFVPTDKHTLQSKKWPNIWVMGDANNIPASKAGSVIHFQIEAVVKNIFDHMNGRPLSGHFDGHSICFIESGDNKAALIDFNYETEPLPGTYPVPLVGPFSLMQETLINHWGKLAFKWMYWNLMLKGIDVPLPSEMSMMGKRP